MYSLTHIKYSQRTLLQAVSFPIAECERNGIEATQTADNKTNPTVRSRVFGDVQRYAIVCPFRGLHFGPGVLEEVHLFRQHGRGEVLVSKAYNIVIRRAPTVEKTSTFVSKAFLVLKQ